MSIETFNFPMTFLWIWSTQCPKGHTSSINNVSRFVVRTSYTTSIDIMKVLTDVSIVFDVLPQMKLIRNYDGCGGLHNYFQLRHLSYDSCRLVLYEHNSHSTQQIWDL